MVRVFRVEGFFGLFRVVEVSGLLRFQGSGVVQGLGCSGFGVVLGFRVCFFFERAQKKPKCHKG